MPYSKPIYGIVILEEEQIGAWKTQGDHELVLNLEDGYLKRIVGEAEENGASLSFLIKPPDVE